LPIRELIATGQGKVGIFSFWHSPVSLKIFLEREGVKNGLYSYAAAGG